MSYFISNLFRDRMVWALLGLSVLTGLIIMDVITFIFMPEPVFNLWVVKITAAAAVTGAIVYGVFRFKHDKRTQRLDDRLPAFLVDRRAFLEMKLGKNREFQTFCHACRHFDLSRLRCLLRLHERKAWIKLNDDSLIRYCLYWNLDDRHPVMKLTERVKEVTNEARSTVDSEKRAEEK